MAGSSFVRVSRLFAALAFAVAPTLAHAAERPFYAGKTLNVIAGEPPGGGTDAYARLLSRHLARHIPGAPAIIVQNMPGAGTLKAVMYLNTTAPTDGTVMTTFSLRADRTGPDGAAARRCEFPQLCLDREHQRRCARLLCVGRERGEEFQGHAEPHQAAVLGGDGAGHRGQCRFRHAAEPVRRENQTRAGLCRKRRQAPRGRTPRDRRGLRRLDLRARGLAARFQDQCRGAAVADAGCGVGQIRPLRRRSGEGRARAPTL